jgi:hypothetical protein
MSILRVKLLKIVYAVQFKNMQFNLEFTHQNSFFTQNVVGAKLSLTTFCVLTSKNAYLKFLCVNFFENSEQNIQKTHENPI